VEHEGKVIHLPKGKRKSRKLFIALPLGRKTKTGQAFDPEEDHHGHVFCKNELKLLYLKFLRNNDFFLPAFPLAPLSWTAGRASLSIHRGAAWQI